jgi:hypothetical protein
MRPTGAKTMSKQEREISILTINAIAAGQATPLMRCVGRPQGFTIDPRFIVSKHAFTVDPRYVSESR